MKWIYSTLLLLLSASVLAAGGGHGEKIVFTKEGYMISTAIFAVGMVLSLIIVFWITRKN